MAKQKPQAEPPAPAPPPAELSEFKTINAREERAWRERSHWDRLYNDAYDFAIPLRRPSKHGEKQKTVERVFDTTAISSSFRFAGQLQQDLFPVGQPFCTLRPGAIAKQTLKPAELEKLERVLTQACDVGHAMIQTAEWDQSTHEMCLDLAAGTGFLLMLEGDARRPIRHMSLPADECALELGPFNEIAALYWRTRMSRAALKTQFPDGRYPESFVQAMETANGQQEEILVKQAFVQEGRRWLFRVWLENSETFVARGSFRTQPFLAPRYCRVPGEAYGRGPILLAMPAIKTLNKAQELTLKAAAIQMLGIWGYRPGGAFNPDTARIAPGVFWPVGSTGGVLGAEVARLDPASGKLEVANLVLNNQREQVQSTMHDERLPDQGATPHSATEIMARMRRLKQSHIGAFGRLVNETIPVAMRRAIDIGYRKGVMDYDLELDELLVACDVISPMAAALRADHLTPMLEYMQLVAQVRGPQLIDLHANVDDMLDHIGREMGVKPQFIPTAEQRAALKEKMAAAAAQLAQLQAGQADGQQAAGASA